MKLTDPIKAWAEAEFQNWVLERAGEYGGMRQHTKLARYVPKGRKKQPLIDRGFPDLVLAKEGKVIFAELKTEKGAVRKEQKQWLELLGGVLWRPRDMDQIIKVLSGESDDYNE